MLLRYGKGECPRAPSFTFVHLLPRSVARPPAFSQHHVYPYFCRLHSDLVSFYACFSFDRCFVRCRLPLRIVIRRRIIVTRPRTESHGSGASISELETAHCPLERLLGTRAIYRENVRHASSSPVSIERLAGESSVPVPKRCRWERCAPKGSRGATVSILADDTVAFLEWLYPDHTTDSREQQSSSSFNAQPTIGRKRQTTRRLRQTTGKGSHSTLSEGTPFESIRYLSTKSPNTAPRCHSQPLEGITILPYGHTCPHPASSKNSSLGSIGKTASTKWTTKTV